MLSSSAGWRRRVLTSICLLLALCPLGCVPESDETRTLASLERVDGYPLYVMRYYGAYGGPRLLDDTTTASERESRNDPWACTTFAALDQGRDALLGRNFDWHTQAALLLYTDPPDGYASVSMVDITYLGFGKRRIRQSERDRLLDAAWMPFDGMNDQGLAVGMMALPRAPVVRDPTKPTVDSLAIIRLMLDHARDVDQALEILAGYNVDFESGPLLHYLLADAGGSSAVVEYASDEMRILRATEPWQVSTNFVMSEARELGHEAPCERYRTAYAALERARGGLSEEEALALLGAVSQPSTIWSAVYNLSSGDTRIAMGREYDDAHRFQLEMAHE